MLNARKLWLELSARRGSRMNHRCKWTRLRSVRSLRKIRSSQIAAAAMQAELLRRGDLWQCCTAGLRRHSGTVIPSEVEGPAGAGEVKLTTIGCQQRTCEVLRLRCASLRMTRRDLK